MQTVIKQITDNLQTIAENTVKVYNAGLEEGKKLGGDYQTAYQQGYDDGVSAGYDNGREEGKEEGSA
jgi:flagellar biosynthesis/type III secretory pathway protein FliH